MPLSEFLTALATRGLQGQQNFNQQQADQLPVIGKSLVAGTVGLPADLAVLASMPQILNNPNVTVEDAFKQTPMTADWIGQKMGVDVDSPAFILSQFLSPSPADVAVPAAKGLAKLSPDVLAALSGMTAWHGSPHKFDKFQMDKIGTGEGAQAYGHGLYFAENRGVATGYQFAHGGSLRYNGQPLSQNNFNGTAANILGEVNGFTNEGLPIEEAIAKARKSYAEWGSVEDFDRVIDEAKPSLSVGETSLYEVDIPDSAVEKMLDWDAPLSEQPESVQRALAELAAADDPLLKELFADGVPTEALGVFGNSKGGQIYNTLAEQSGGSAALSAKLNELGIPGIKYFDGNSRSAGEGTRNLVVFDENLVNVVSRNGERLTPDEAAVMADLSGDELITTHNLSAENLEKAEELGGLAMPSIGIVNPENPIQGYGDITLVGDETLVRPGARNPVFSADAYSPRQPRAEVQYSDAEMSSFNQFVESVDESGSTWQRVKDPDGRSYLYDSDPEAITRDGVVEFLRTDSIGRAGFLKEKGLMPPMEGNSFDWRNSLQKIIEKKGLEGEFSEWAADKAAELGMEGRKMIRVGSTPMGRPSYRAETMENVLREMRKEMRGSDGSSNLYGAGHLRSQVAPKFRSLKEIKAARGKLKSAEDLVDYKDSMNNELSELTHEFGRYSDYTDTNPFIVSSVNMERLTEVLSGQAKWDEYFPDAPAELKQRANEYIEELASGYTEYFEGKPMRAVGIDEFKVALIPEKADPKVRQTLESKGLKVETYDGTEEGRKAALKRQKALMYSAVVGAILYRGAQQQEQPMSNVNSVIATRGLT